MSQTVSEGLETTLASLELRHEAAAHVAAMQAIARRMDFCTDPDLLAKLANTFQRQLVELKNWVVVETAEADPWDTLALALAKDAE